MGCRGGLRSLLLRWLPDNTQGAYCLVEIKDSSGPGCCHLSGMKAQKY
jgi:hypothetical protein